MEPKFTPGPWRKDRYGSLIGTNGKRVVMYGLSVSHSMVSPSAEERANATLAEAAPEMFDALTTFVKEAQSWHEFHGHMQSGSVQCDSLCAAIPAAEAAIAKALGQEGAQGR